METQNAPHEELVNRLRAVTLGDYDIIGELGRGGMATVFLAHDLALDRKVAIKVLHPVLLMGEGMVDRFKREARTAAALTHPHIIPIHAVRETDEVLFFVMKYVAGSSLASIIEEQGPLPVKMVQTVLAQVSGALGYAHRRGVVHRDVKPANIMIDDDGSAVVTDFGIAKLTEVTGLTATGTAIGTPHYMSPEQCSSLPVTGASDQYSLGVVGYEMLTGRTPFRGTSLMDIMRAHFFETPAPLVVARPECPPELATAIDRMLAKQPEQRWPSIEAAVAGIGTETLSRDDPIRAQLIELARSGQKPVARVSGPVSPTPLRRNGLTRPGAGSRPAPMAPRKKQRRFLAIALGVVGVVVGGWLGYRAIRPTPAPHAASAPTAPGPSSLPSVQRVSVSPKRLTLRVGQRRRMTGSAFDSHDGLVASAALAWSSSDPSVAGVDSGGSVTAVAAGEAVIRVRFGDLVDSATVRVARVVTSTPPIPPTPGGTGAIWIGTRGHKAVLYVNNQAQGAIPRLSRWSVPSGTIHLSIREEGCIAWESTVVVPPDTVLRLGYKNPKCPG
jgi:serine/threonine-protein kinase